jgi:hypothetical protein
VGGQDKGHDRVVVHHNIVFGDAQIKIKYVEKLAFYPTDIALAKHTSAYSPVHVLERRVIQIFASCDESTEEYTFICPLFEGNVEVRLSPVQIDKGSQDDRQFNLSTSDNVVDHCGEGRPLGVP